MVARRLLSAVASKSSAPPSISFSGAGFLGSYHLGVISYLSSAGLLLPSTDKSQSQVLCGSSAGSLVSAAHCAGASPETCMEVVVSRVASAARNQGPLTALTPGFSLVDALSPFLLKVMHDAAGTSDPAPLDDFVRERMNGGVLQVFLTDPARFRFPGDFSSHSYVDEFEGMDHVVSSCILSSYVPVATGPLRPAQGTVVHDATEFMKTRKTKRMSRKGEVEVEPQPRWWDGGLAAMFPRINRKTLVISPVSIRHPKNLVICPPWTGNPKGLKIGEGGMMADISFANAVAAKNMVLPVEDDVYERIYRDAYDDAKRVCMEAGLVPS